MKHIRAFFVLIPCVAQGLQFETTPSIRRFSDGAIEWSASVSCGDPTLLLGARVVFSLDADGDGVGDTAVASLLSPADCEGDRIRLSRRFFPTTPAVLRAELHTILTSRAGNSEPSDSVTDVHSVLTGEAGSMLSLRRFCARPKNGEPEWIEIRNSSTVTVSLSKVRLEGRALAASAAFANSDTSLPGESLTAVAAADTAEIRLWQPGARVFPLSSWPGLRNTGDTLRLALDVKARDGLTTALVLDSVVYDGGASAREECASVPTEESSAAAHGFGLELPPGRWKRRADPLTVTVTAPAPNTGALTSLSADNRYELRVYDLDGMELCVLARGAIGPQTFSLSSASCGRLRASATAVLLLLQPRHAPSVRKLLWITP